MSVSSISRLTRTSERPMQLFHTRFPRWMIAPLLCFFHIWSATAFSPHASTSVTMTRPVHRHARTGSTGPTSSPYQDNNRPPNSQRRLSILPLSDVSLANPFWKACGIYAATDAFGFLVSLVTGSHWHLDLIGTGAFALASLPNALPGSSTKTSLSQRASSIAISIWAIKLATFLCYRATQVGKDHRLTETLSTLGGTFGFWFITFLWNVCCSLPYLLGLLSNQSNTTLVQVGGLVFLLGLVLETTADLQKWMFKRSHQSDQFCNVGLWAVSQHPNFLGNWILWAGIFIMNLPAFLLVAVPPTPTVAMAASAATAWTSRGYLFVARYHRLGLALLSPLFLCALFGGQASGVVTNATQLALAKYGNDPAYLRYIQEVPKIVPKIRWGPTK